MADCRMHLNLSGQRAVVFGAAKGIGRAIAEGFLAAGCEVIGFDRLDQPKALRAAGDITTGDVTQLDSVRAFARTVGSVDHVIYPKNVSRRSGFFWQPVTTERYGRRY